MIELLHRLVEVESPSITPSAHEPALRLLEDGLRTAGCTTRRIAGNAPGSHLFARPESPAHGAPYQLIVGHFDTVWPLGTVAARPRASKTADSTGRAHSTPRPGWFSTSSPCALSAPTASPRP